MFERHPLARVWAIATLALAGFATSAVAAPEKDLAEWTEADIKAVNPILRGALRNRIEVAKYKASREEGSTYRSAEERMVERIGAFGTVCKEGDDCGGAAAVAPVAAAAGRSGSDIYNKYCVACHATGLAGAPKLGVADEWDPRMEKGMDAVLTNTVQGINTMPPMGTCMDCSEDELQTAIDYMMAGQ